MTNELIKILQYTHCWNSSTKLLYGRAHRYISSHPHPNEEVKVIVEGARTEAEPLRTLCVCGACQRPSQSPQALRLPAGCGRRASGAVAFVDPVRTPVGMLAIIPVTVDVPLEPEDERCSCLSPMPLVRVQGR